MTSYALGSGWLQVETGLGLSVGSVAVGGQAGYAEILDADGSHNSFVHAVTSGAVEVPNVMGLAFDPGTGTLYLVTSDSLTGTNIPHDVAWIHGEDAILVALMTSTGVLELRKYSSDGTALLDTWTPTPPPGWGQQHVSIDMACDGHSVIIGWMLGVLTRFDLDTGLDETDYVMLAAGSPYLYGGVVWASREAGDSRDALVAMSRSGTGPQQAVARGAGGSLWTDVINPTGDYKVVKRRLSDGDFLASYTTQATPTPTNGPSLSLAVYFNPCAARERVWISSIGV